ncbi:MAG: ABC transporter ATP-binding protein [Bifidobacteriaceae bacterium]|jgi:iron complex transport system ATP-binding protein|nr:ABC transporter ATP-binding protein [Bifidobacteriaceae bacterium]
MTGGALVVEGLTWRAGGRVVVAGVTFEAAAGQVTVLMGPNGAGKTTVLRGLLGLLPGATGTAQLDGADLWAMAPRQRAARVSLVAAEGLPAHGLTVHDVALLGRHPRLGLFGTPGPQDLAAVADALAAAGVTGLAERDFRTLSDGERQRVRLARALAVEPAALVLDEPEAHLDLAARAGLARLLRALADQGLLVLAAVHDLTWAAGLADRVVVLGPGGQVAAQGAPSDVLTPAVVERVFGVPCRVLADPQTGAPVFAFGG